MLARFIGKTFVVLFLGYAALLTILPSSVFPHSTARLSAPRREIGVENPSVTKQLVVSKTPSWTTPLSTSGPAADSQSFSQQQFAKPARSTATRNGETKRDKVVIACMGDSITFGFGVKKNMDYPSQLQMMLGPKYNVRNFGHSGRCMQKKPPWSYWKSPKFAEAIKIKADVVVLMLGTNDGAHKTWGGPESFKKDYQAMIAAIRRMRPEPAIYIVIPPPVYRDLRIASSKSNPSKKPPPTPEEARTINYVIPGLIRDIHVEAQLPTAVIDVFEVMGGAALSHPDWSMDGTHPTEIGYTQIAFAVKNSLSHGNVAS